MAGLFNRPGKGAPEEPAARVAPETVVKTEASEVEKIKAELALALEALEKERAARSTAEKSAEDAAKALSEAQGHMVLQRDITEIPTGKQVTVKRVKEYEVVSYREDGRPHYKPIFEDVKLPTFFYRIDLPASGGKGVNLNQHWFYQDQTYELDVDTLRTVKDIVHRAWQHEAQIKGSNENVFRRPRNTMLSGRAGAR